MSAVLLIAGGLLKARGHLEEGKIAKAQGQLERNIAIRNQQALERQAKVEQEVAAIEERRIARREKIFLSRQIAVAGKSGIGLAGATMSVLADAASQFSMDKNLALRSGLLKSRALRERGRIIRAQGQWAYTLGKRAKRASYFKAAASILGGVAASGIGPSSGRVSGPTQIGTPSPSIYNRPRYA
ncbi:hypothetical protein LCGC14_2005540 [marine sediment metagenome]|uniref:Uncharacterized protein n=1 Tax=marine sediment metagenome TaxID=412755 RepID=A0A0F9F1Z5_9ZZZZ